MPEARRFSELSPARQTLVRILQAINFGEIQGIRVRKADPLFDDASVVIIDAKLDEGPRPELQLSDFVLKEEVVRLMAHLDSLKNGAIQAIEVRAGVPRGIVLRSALPDFCPDALRAD